MSSYEVAERKRVEDSIKATISNWDLKRQLSKQLMEQTEEFIKNGGEIQQLDSYDSAFAQRESQIKSEREVVFNKYNMDGLSV